jgi:hypothetical protein
VVAFVRDDQRLSDRASTSFERRAGRERDLLFTPQVRLKLRPQIGECPLQLAQPGEIVAVDSDHGLEQGLDRARCRGPASPAKPERDPVGSDLADHLRQHGCGRVTASRSWRGRVTAVPRGDETPETGAWHASR